MLSLMRTGLLPPFFNTNSLFTSSLRCKALRIVMSYLVLYSIYWSSFFVHFKNSPEYLTRRGQSWCLYLWWDSCYIVLFQIVFSFSRDTLMYFFLSSQLLWWRFGSFIPSFTCHFPLLIISKLHFSMPNSLHMSSLYILNFCVRTFNSLSFSQTVWYHQCYWAYYYHYYD